LVGNWGKGSSSGLYTAPTVTQSGTTYFYVVTSQDANGVESAFSNQLQALVPTP
jgi:fibronectin type 3 domain-containing protein